MKILFILIFTLATASSYCQTKPKLVVGIVVDQMKEEYLYKFQKNFTDHGFNKLLTHGAALENVHYNYIPTYTAPGHASIYTGTTPYYHGIIGNNWYSREEKDEVYCVRDNNVTGVGTSSKYGKASPHQMLTTTITDELRISTQMKAKVVSISIKDRGAILPGGFTGDSYWFDYSTGDFISSTFYMDQLPGWLEKLNSKKLADHYLNTSWERLLPEALYFTDEKNYASYEKVFKGAGSADFPYDLKKIRQNYDYALLANTPFGNDLLTEAAKAALDGEALGEDDVTDFLAISYSSTDIIGHDFGPQSQELEDTYYRLDKNIGALIEYLDEKVGKGNYLLFLTADHAVADVPKFLSDKNIPAGIFSQKSMHQEIDSILHSIYKIEDMVSSISNFQVFLDREKIRAAKLDLYEVQQKSADYLIVHNKNVAHSWTARAIHNSSFDEGGLKGLLIRGYNQKRSGDVLYTSFPGWFSSSSTSGTTHGSPFPYDTHVPLLWYGWKIKPLSSVRKYEVTDIAVTLALLLDIRIPNGSIGKPIMELFEE